MAQVKSGAETSASMACMPYIMYMPVLVIGYPKTFNFSSWYSSLNSHPGGKAGCGKEQYHAKVLSCGQERQILLENFVCIYAGRRGFKIGTRT